MMWVYKIISVLKSSKLYLLAKHFLKIHSYSAHFSASINHHVSILVLHLFLACHFSA